MHLAQGHNAVPLVSLHLLLGLWQTLFFHAQLTLGHEYEIFLDQNLKCQQLLAFKIYSLDKCLLVGARKLPHLFVLNICITIFMKISNFMLM